MPTMKDDTFGKFLAGKIADYCIKREECSRLDSNTKSRYLAFAEQALAEAIDEVLRDAVPQTIDDLV